MASLILLIASAHHKDTDVLGEIETGSEIEVEVINYKLKPKSFALLKSAGQRRS